MTSVHMTPSSILASQFFDLLCSSYHHLLPVTGLLKIVFPMRPSCGHTALLLNVRHFPLAPFIFQTLAQSPISAPLWQPVCIRVWLPPGKQLKGLSSASAAPHFAPFLPSPVSCEWTHASFNSVIPEILENPILQKFHSFLSTLIGPTTSEGMLPL